jgi:hypothetical protein
VQAFLALLVLDRTVQNVVEQHVEDVALRYPRLGAVRGCDRMRGDRNGVQRRGVRCPERIGYYRIGCDRLRVRAFN